MDNPHAIHMLSTYILPTGKLVKFTHWVKLYPYRPIGSGNRNGNGACGVVWCLGVVWSAVVTRGVVRCDAVSCWDERHGDGWRAVDLCD